MDFFFPFSCQHPASRVLEKNLQDIFPCFCCRVMLQYRHSDFVCERGRVQSSFARIPPTATSLNTDVDLLTQWVSTLNQDTLLHCQPSLKTAHSGELRIHSALLCLSRHGSIFFVGEIVTYYYCVSYRGVLTTSRSPGEKEAQALAKPLAPYFRDPSKNHCAVAATEYFCLAHAHGREVHGFP